MQFFYCIEKISKNGVKESVVEPIDKDFVLLGRGASCDILLSGRIVSLEHAKIFVQDGKLQIEDLGSLSGVQVNKSIVARTRLKEGDLIKIGEHQLSVVKNEGQWGFLEVRDQTIEAVDTESLIADQEKSLRFQNRVPSYTFLSLVACVLVFVIFGLLPAMGMSLSLWNSGAISNPHRMISSDCSQCHSTAFEQVQDQQCVTCHQMSEHAEGLSSLVSSHQELGYRCAQCHMEHNGDSGIIASESVLCTECHSRLDTLGKPSTSKVPSLEEHPAFRVSVKSEIGKFGKVELTNSVKDSSRIKFPHDLHLAPDISGENGPVTMECTDCHTYTDDIRDFKVLNFESNCESCHPLEFDPRLPGKSVPHGKADVIYNYLFAEYSKLSLVGEGNTQERAPARRKPGQSVERAQELEFSRQSVETLSRETEESLFTRTACHLCHFVKDIRDADIEESTSEEKIESAEGMSFYSIENPKIPSDWFPSSIFDHGAHQAVTCESCHNNVRRSESAESILLPQIDNCLQCHQETLSKEHSVKSDCVTCHSYHDPLEMDSDTKRAIEKVLMTNTAN